MKQSKERDCKIVQDLLPNYIEKLTNEITNEFIEEHIETCGECKKAIQYITRKVEVEELDQEEEINYLKRLNKKVKMKIAVVSLIVIIIASSISIYVYNKSKIKVDNYTFLRANYIVENKEETIDGKVYGTLIAVIDDKNICKSVRVVEEGYTEESAKQKLEYVKNYNTVFLMNEKIESGTIHYNYNIWNGIKKDELIIRWKDNCHVSEVEEM